MEVQVKITKNDKNSISKGSKRKSSSKPINNQTSNHFTEFDEAEMLCLPNSNRKLFLERNTSSSKYPENYNVQKYMGLDTAEERRKYRNSKDLRYNDHNKAEELVPGICLRQVRGEKCLVVNCAYRHELRLPKKLRLCFGWKNGFCPDGQSCRYLHSEFPCRYHYLGINSKRHDPQTCAFYHGGPLPKEYEEMFLDSINSNHNPNAREMYNKQVKKLETTRCNSVNAQIQADTSQSKTEGEQRTRSRWDVVGETEIKHSSKTVVDNERSLCKRDWESSGETKLQIDGHGLQVDETTLRIDKTSFTIEENSLPIDKPSLPESGKSNLPTFESGKSKEEPPNSLNMLVENEIKEASVIAVKGESEDCESSDESKLHIDEDDLQIDEATLQINETGIQVDKYSIKTDESGLPINEIGNKRK